MKYAQCVIDCGDGDTRVVRFRTVADANLWAETQTDFEEWDCYPYGRLEFVDTESNSFFCEPNHEEILQKMLAEHKQVVEQSEKKLANYALEHNLPLYLGEYGLDGRSLILKNGTDGMSEMNYTQHYGTQPGSWLYSSETC